MTSPDETTKGEVERVPLKVVPLYVQPLQPLENDEPPADELDDDIEEGRPKRRTPAVAVFAGTLALGTIGVHAAAVVVSSQGDYATGASLAYVAIGLSVLAVLTAIVAVVVGRGRAWAVGAALLAVLANPFVLLTVLDFLSGAAAA